MMKSAFGSSKGGKAVVLLVVPGEFMEGECSGISDGGAAALPVDMVV